MITPPAVDEPRHLDFPPGADYTRGRPAAADHADLGIQDYLQEALQLRAWGMTTIPLGPDKRPTGRWKHLQNRKPTDRVISRMFEYGGSRVRGLGLLHGRASGRPGAIHATRDFDDRDGYARWADGNRELAADCPTVISYRGAHVHLFLRGDREVFETLPDGELRASSGCYTALPPSTHPSGVRYRWRDGPPLSPSDFPLVRLADTGFITTTALTQDTRSRTKPRPQPEPRLRNPPNGLCPIPAPPRMADLPPTVREAVLRTLPRCPGEREIRLLTFARALVGIEPRVPASHWLSAAKYWHTSARAVIRTEPWEETWQAFARAWNRCDRSTAETRPYVVMTTAAASAGEEPLDRLKAACRAKAADSPDGTFYLSVRLAGTLAGVKKSQGGNLLAKLRGDGFLVMLKAGTPGASSRRASTFRIGTTASTTREGITHE